MLDMLTAGAAPSNGDTVGAALMRHAADSAQASMTRPGTGQQGLTSTEAARRPTLAKTKQSER